MSSLAAIYRAARATISSWLLVRTTLNGKSSSGMAVSFDRQEQKKNMQDYLSNGSPVGEGY
jgi:hypothetical protein